MDNLYTVLALVDVDTMIEVVLNAQQNCNLLNIETQAKVINYIIMTLQQKTLDALMSHFLCQFFKLLRDLLVIYSLAV